MKKEQKFWVVCNTENRSPVDKATTISVTWEEIGKSGVND